MLSSVSTSFWGRVSHWTLPLSAQTVSSEPRQLAGSCLWLPHWEHRQPLHGAEDPDSKTHSHSKHFVYQPIPSPCLLLIPFKQHFIYLFVFCLWGEHATACRYRSEESLWKSVLSFHHAGHRDQTQVIRLDDLTHWAISLTHFVLWHKISECSPNWP